MERSISRAGSARLSGGTLVLLSVCQRDAWAELGTAKCEGGKVRSVSGACWLFGFLRCSVFVCFGFLILLLLF